MTWMVGLWCLTPL